MTTASNSPAPTWIEVRDFTTCPRCGALPGQDCRGRTLKRSGSPHDRTALHQERWKLYRAQRLVTTGHSPARQLHEAVLVAIGQLAIGDPAADTLAGTALATLAKACEDYERATLPPPFGTKVAP